MRAETSTHKRSHRDEVCHCKAYPFPHRMGSGKCWAFESGPFCGSCGEPCTARIIDQGIGSYECWGEKGFDSRKVLASDCCKAELYANAELTIYYRGGEDEESF